MANLSISSAQLLQRAAKKQCKLRFTNTQSLRKYHHKINDECKKQYHESGAFEEYWCQYHSFFTDIELVQRHSWKEEFLQ